ncbi:hypothetical protein [Bacillus sp. V2I10]|uniref:hypothetical protein n=1 Tax=Bacillus sp. V2I10 TaxID=3042276 RepID=UPI00277DF6AF|nr:hypothetical protein [Bacillus sp. V2I10]MDQ0862001.1 hypothetical protein [Bacillus sp. V2I10]
MNQKNKIITEMAFSSCPRQMNLLRSRKALNSNHGDPLHEIFAKQVFILYPLKHCNEPESPFSSQNFARTVLPKKDHYTEVHIFRKSAKKLHFPAAFPNRLMRKIVKKSQ